MQAPPAMPLRPPLPPSLSFSSACTDDTLFPPLYPLPSASPDTPTSSHPLAPPDPGPHPCPPRHRHQRSVSHEERIAFRQPVYIIRCAHCDTFLTDRGMRAVLLLKPHITLFSTDAVPTACVPAYAASPALGDVPDPHTASKQRSCSCFTQTLACPCGTVVGYTVITACTKCSESASCQSKGPNGHRTVFHCSEISAHERRYVPGDQGVHALAVPAALVDLLAESKLVDDQLSAIAKHGKGLDVPEQKSWVHTLTQRSDALQRELRDIYTHTRNGYLTGARIILSGETVFWSDLLLLGGEQSQPFDPEPILASHPFIGI